MSCEESTFVSDFASVFCVFEDMTMIVPCTIKMENLALSRDLDDLVLSRFL